MILALTRRSQSVDLMKLDLASPQKWRYSRKLASLSSQGRETQEQSSFSPHSRVWTVSTLWTYKQKTESFRKQGDTECTRLFLVVVKPHKPVCSSTLARWLKSLVEKAGIDTGIFKVHSVRGAATCTCTCTSAALLHTIFWRWLTGIQSQSSITSQFDLAHLEQQCSPKVDRTQYKLPQMIWSF